MDTTSLSDRIAALTDQAPYDRALAAIAAAEQTTRPPTPDELHRRISDIAAAIADAALSGDELPVDLVEQRHAELEREARTIELRKQLITARRIIEDRRQEAYRNNEPRALELCETEIQDIITETKRIDAALGSITSAEEAIRQGLADEWSTLQALVSGYEQARRTQQGLIPRSEAHLLEVYGTIGNPQEFDPAVAKMVGIDIARPSWPGLRNATSRPTRHHDPAGLDGRRALTFPWWSSDVLDDNRAAFLRWLATTTDPTPEVWCPSLAEMKELESSLNALRPARTTDYSPRDSGLAKNPEIEAARRREQERVARETRIERRRPSLPIR